MKLTSVHAAPLAHFLEVADRGSLTAAAEALHITISSVSRQVARLEEDLGVQLFERDPRGMRLTEAGVFVREYATRAFLEAEDLRAELQGLQSLSNTTVHVSCSEGFAHDYLPYVMAGFHGLHPGVRFTLEVCSPAEATRAVRAGGADVALSFAMAAQEGIHVEYSEDAPVYALVSKRHALARRESVALKELMDYPLVLPTGANTIRQLFDIACGLEGLRTDAAMTSNSLAALNAYQRHGNAVTLCGSLSVRNRLRESQQVLIPIDSLPLQQRLMQVQSLAGRRLSPAVRAFVDYLVDDIRGRRRTVRGRRRKPRDSHRR